MMSEKVKLWVGMFLVVVSLSLIGDAEGIYDKVFFAFSTLVGIIGINSAINGMMK